MYASARIRCADFPLLQDRRIAVPRNRRPADHPIEGTPVGRGGLSEDRLFRGACSRSRSRSSRAHPILPWDRRAENGGSACDRR